MPRIPAVCSHCGLIFPSPFNLSGINNTFYNVGAQCPRCGKNARILDGVYSGIGNTIQALLFGTQSKAELETLINALMSAQAGKASPEEIKEAIKAHAPDLAALADSAPKSEEAFRGWVQAICALITVILLIYNQPTLKTQSKEEIQKLIEKEVTKALDKQQKEALQAMPTNRHFRRAEATKTRRRPQKPKRR